MELIVGTIIKYFSCACKLIFVSLFPCVLMQNLYDSFVSARDREERGLTEKRDGRADKPRQGNTIFVSGCNITEDFLKKAFHTYGNIVNVTMEIEKK
jgi:hypothetical protein